MKLLSLLDQLETKPQVICYDDCSGAPFKKFASLREEWALKNRYISPGWLSIPYISTFFISALQCTIVKSGYNNLSLILSLMDFGCRSYSICWANF